MTRRELMSWLAVAGGAGIVGAVAVPAVIHSLSPVLQPVAAPLWQPVGVAADFPRGEVRKAHVQVPRDDWARSLSEKGVYVWHSPQEGLVVFARNCTDLGCPIEHDPGSNWFFCPCHGGVFSTDGTPQAGPPNRPLYRFASRVREGVLEIDLRSLPSIV
ncbi:MAG: ubiquinol-cytochrome c reductase iron-sulfur subunit [Bacteroidota bacterium]